MLAKADEADTNSSRISHEHYVKEYRKSITSKMEHLIENLDPSKVRIKSLHDLERADLIMRRNLEMEDKETIHEKNVNVNIRISRRNEKAKKKDAPIDVEDC